MRDVAEEIIKLRATDGGSVSTLYEFDSIVRAHIVPFFGDMQVGTIGSDQLLAFRDHLVKDHRAADHAQHLQGAGRLPRRGRRRKLEPTLTTNPLRSAREDGLVKMPKVKHGEIVYIVLADAAKLRALRRRARASARPLRYLLALLGGARDGEPRGPHVGRRRPRRRDPDDDDPAGRVRAREP